MSELTAKQARFVEEYLKDSNATQAAIRAGYSSKSAEKLGHDLLKLPQVSQKLKEENGKRARKSKISSTWVIKRLVKEALGQGRDTKSSSRVKALELLGKHLGILREKLELTGKDGGPIKTEETTMTDEERLERINKLILAVKARQAQLEGAKP